MNVRSTNLLINCTWNLVYYIYCFECGYTLIPIRYVVWKILLTSSQTISSMIHLIIVINIIFDYGLIFLLLYSTKSFYDLIYSFVTRSISAIKIQTRKRERQIIDSYQMSPFLYISSISWEGRKTCSKFFTNGDVIKGRHCIHLIPRREQS